MGTNTLLRRSGTGLLVAVALAGLAAGCSSSGSQASPIPGSGTGGAPTTVVTSSPITASRGSVTTAPVSAAKGKGVEPSSADLSALDRDLQSAGRDLDSTSSAIQNADVDTAKNQEGSAP